MIRITPKLKKAKGCWRWHRGLRAHPASVPVGPTSLELRPIKLPCKAAGAAAALPRAGVP